MCEGDVVFLVRSAVAEYDPRVSSGAHQAARLLAAAERRLSDSLTKLRSCSSLNTHLEQPLNSTNDYVAQLTSGFQFASPDVQARTLIDEHLNVDKERLQLLIAEARRLLQPRANLVHSAHAATFSDIASRGVRLVDSTGFMSNVGLLQVHTDAGFGTVCGMNTAAADVVCRSLGFAHGSVGSSPCGVYGGANLCAAASTPVAMRDLECTGGELDIQECKWSTPDDMCPHASDAVLYCAREGGVGLEGTLRLMSSDGAPSIDGQGRVEIYSSGSWAPVCSSGFTEGAETVACKQMGFEGASEAFRVARPACASFKSGNNCGATPPRLSELACNGQETTVAQCSFEEGDDVWCAPEESVVIGCAGDGDTIR